VGQLHVENLARICDVVVDVFDVEGELREVLDPQQRLADDGVVQQPLHVGEVVEQLDLWNHGHLVADDVVVGDREPLPQQIDDGHDVALEGQTRGDVAVPHGRRHGFALQAAEDQHNQHRDHVDVAEQLVRGVLEVALALALVARDLLHQRGVQRVDVDVVGLVGGTVVGAAGLVDAADAVDVQPTLELRPLVFGAAAAAALGATVLLDHVAPVGDVAVLEALREVALVVMHLAPELDQLRVDVFGDGRREGEHRKILVAGQQSVDGPDALLHAHGLEFLCRLLLMGSGSSSSGGAAAAFALSHREFRLAAEELAHALEGDREARAVALEDGIRLLHLPLLGQQQHVEHILRVDDVVAIHIRNGVETEVHVAAQELLVRGVRVVVVVGLVVLRAAGGVGHLLAEDPVVPQTLLHAVADHVEGASVQAVVDHRGAQEFQPFAAVAHVVVDGVRQLPLVGMHQPGAQHHTRQWTDAHPANLATALAQETHVAAQVHRGHELAHIDVVQHADLARQRLGRHNGVAVLVALAALHKEDRVVGRLVQPEVLHPPHHPRPADGGLDVADRTLSAVANVVRVVDVEDRLPFVGVLHQHQQLGVVVPDGLVVHSSFVLVQHVQQLIITQIESSCRLLHLFLHQVAVDVDDKETRKERKRK